MECYNEKITNYIEKIQLYLDFFFNHSSTVSYQEKEFDTNKFLEVKITLKEHKLFSKEEDFFLYFNVDNKILVSDFLGEENYPIINNYSLEKISQKIPDFYGHGANSAPINKLFNDKFINKRSSFTQMISIEDLMKKTSEIKGVSLKEWYIQNLWDIDKKIKKNKDAIKTNSICISLSFLVQGIEKEIELNYDFQMYPAKKECSFFRYLKKNKRLKKDPEDHPWQQLVEDRFSKQADYDELCNAIKKDIANTDGFTHYQAPLIKTFNDIEDQTIDQNQETLIYLLKMLSKASSEVNIQNFKNLPINTPEEMLESNAKTSLLLNQLHKTIEKQKYLLQKINELPKPPESSTYKKSYDILTRQIDNQESLLNHQIMLRQQVLDFQRHTLAKYSKALSNQKIEEVKEAMKTFEIAS